MDDALGRSEHHDHRFATTRRGTSGASALVSPQNRNEDSGVMDDYHESNDKDHVFGEEKFKSAGEMLRGHNEGRRTSLPVYRETLGGNKTNSNAANTSHGAIVNAIVHPVLHSRDPKQVIAFLEKREECEEKIQALQESSAAPIYAASWKISDKRPLQKTLYALGKFKNIAPGKSYMELTEDNVKEAILAITEKARKKRFDSREITNAVSKLRTDMTIVDPEARIFMLIARFN